MNREQSLSEGEMTHEMSEPFKIGRYYKHNSGIVMHIVSAGFTTLYGWTLIAEKHGISDLVPVGDDIANTINWRETTVEEWRRGFGSGVEHEDT